MLSNVLSVVSWVAPTFGIVFGGIVLNFICHLKTGRLLALSLFLALLTALF